MVQQWVAIEIVAYRRHPANGDGVVTAVVLAPQGGALGRAVMIELAADQTDPERGCNSFDLPVSRQTLTYHFRTLRKACLIDETDYGNRKGIRLRRRDLTSASRGRSSGRISRLR